ncbi:RHS repeat-associated core domain-containing protein [Streptomyces sp. NPDC049813]|uniref:RHS repeat-associated core domain-containing protein n=1 Tax=Streptomyces sp. NPDC049813 TaxID=3365597 RepID=UPI0037B77A05
MGARYYDPQLGRFPQPDPSGKESHLYAYAVGDPTNHMDPSGLDFLGLDKKGWGNARGIAGTLISAAASFFPGCALVAGGIAVASTGLSVAPEEPLRAIPPDRLRLPAFLAQAPEELEPRWRPPKLGARRQR